MCFLVTCIANDVLLLINFRERIKAIKATGQILVHIQLSLVSQVLC